MLLRGIFSSNISPKCVCRFSVIRLNHTPQSNCLVLFKTRGGLSASLLIHWITFAQNISGGWFETHDTGIRRWWLKCHYVIVRIMNKYPCAPLGKRHQQIEVAAAPSSGVNDDFNFSNNESQLGVLNGIMCATHPCAAISGA